MAACAGVHGPVRALHWCKPEKKKKPYTSQILLRRAVIKALVKVSTLGVLNSPVYSRASVLLINHQHRHTGYNNSPTVANLNV